MMTSRSIMPWVAAAALAAASPALAQTNTQTSPQKNQGATQQQSGQKAGQQAGQKAGQQAQGKINYITQSDQNTWKASELIGVDVYGADNQDIGEVNDVLLNRGGDVVGLVLDVGGFLGIGESQVAVPLDAVQIVSGTGGTAGMGGGAGTSGGTSGSGTMSGGGTAGGTGTGTAGGTGTGTGTGAGTSAGTGTAGGTGTSGAGGTSANQNQAATTRARGNTPQRVVLNVTKEQLQAAPKFEQNGAARR